MDFFERLVDMRLSSIDFEVSRDNNGIFTVRSLLFSEVCAQSYSLNDSVDILQEKLRIYPPFRCKAIFG